MYLFGPPVRRSTLFDLSFCNVLVWMYPIWFFTLCFFVSILSPMVPTSPPHLPLYIRLPMYQYQDIILIQISRSNVVLLTSIIMTQLITLKPFSNLKSTKVPPCVFSIDTLSIWLNELTSLIKWQYTYIYIFVVQHMQIRYVKNNFFMWNRYLSP